MSAIRSISLSLLFVFLSARPAQSKVHVEDSQFGFSFDLPIGFEAAPEAKNAPGFPAGDVIACYIHPGVGKSAPTVLLIRRLHGTLGDFPSPLPSTLRNGQTLDLSEENWKSFKLQVNRLPEVANGLSLVTFNVQVPLAPEAVQISISGPPEREKRVRGLVRTILASFDGNTTWSGAPKPAEPIATLSSAERVERFTEGVERLLIFIAVIVAICVGLYLRRKRKKTI